MHVKFEVTSFAILEIHLMLKNLGVMLLWPRPLVEKV